MRLLLTGQVGLDKKKYLEEVAHLARARGQSLAIFHIGEMMYREAPEVASGRILDLPLARLGGLRRAVFRDVLAAADNHTHVIVNTHATFRWKHGLFPGFDFDQLAQFQADAYVALVDNVEAVHFRMLRDHNSEHTLKDLMVWREEEIMATEILARANPNRSVPFFVLSRGRETSTAQTLFRLMYRPGMRKVYPSFPMSHVADLPDTLAEINAFRATLGKRFIAFDPGDVDEKLLYDRAVAAAGDGRQTLPVSMDGNTFALKVGELLGIGADINGQIYSRDFMLVRQSDMIVSYIPELPNGKPGLSSGVERELQHAHDHAKEVFVIWKPRAGPSPFVTETATRVFGAVEEAMNYFEQNGYFLPEGLFGW